MTLDELIEMFQEDNDEYIRFDRVVNKRSSRPDIHAFLLLDELCPPSREGRDMVCDAEHDEIWLDTKPEILAANCTKEHVIELIRCGVRCSDGMFCMFV